MAHEAALIHSCLCTHSKEEKGFSMSIDITTAAPEHSSAHMVASASHARVLDVRNLEKVYGVRGGSTRALAGVSFGVDAGELVAIMGPSGSGKSTLLNCIATIDIPTSGSIMIGGQDTSRLKHSALADFRRTKLGFIFQDANLLDTLTARENIALPLTIGRVAVGEIRGRVSRIAEALGVAEVLDKYPYQMSGGQRQRVAAARALVGDPRLVLADEPTGALDSKNSQLLLESLEALNRRLSTTVLMVTHDSFAASFCRRVLFIRDGRLFTEIVRGSDSRRKFFDEIMQVVSMVGGVDDVR
jgi:putative ABC transport system ATP-binding protein